MERHFTATVYLFHEGKVLLHRHPKFGKWLPPGGHVEPNETPPEAARREVKEETSLDIEFLDQEHLHMSFPHASTLERPFHCLLENIPEKNGKPAHQHMDLIYLARPVNLAQLNSIPVDFQWFEFEKLSSIEHELFEDTRQILNYLTNGGDASLLSALFQHQPLS